MNGVRHVGHPVGEVEFQGFDFSGVAAAREESAPTFGDLFADVFVNSAVSRTSGSGRQGVDLHARVSVAFEEAMRGGKRELTLTRVARCDVCGGSGVCREVEVRCPECAGSGRLRWTRGHMVFSRQCAQCHGSGRRSQRPCGACRTEGVVSRTELVVVPIPAGVIDGLRFRIAGQGSAGSRGGEAGDLYVTVTVEPHPVFDRDGDDLQLVVPVAVHEASLGARVEVPAGVPRYVFHPVPSPVSDSGCGGAGRRRRSPESAATWLSVSGSYCREFWMSGRRS